MDENKSSGERDVRRRTQPEPQGDSRRDAMRMAEAILFASAEPVAEKEIEKRLPQDVSVSDALRALRKEYSTRGVNLVRIGGKWAFRTAPDLGFLMRAQAKPPAKLSRAALEALAIIAYHQPVTRAEIEEIRGVITSPGTLDALMEAEWIRIRGRKRTPGRPILYGVTDSFLDHFGLESMKDLPGFDELKEAGLLDSQPADGFTMPSPERNEENGFEFDSEAESDSDSAFASDSEFEVKSEADSGSDGPVASDSEAEADSDSDDSVARHASAFGSDGPVDSGSDSDGREDGDEADSSFPGALRSGS